MAKSKSKPTGSSQAESALASFSGTMPQTISRDEIYHRLEWYFDKSHDPLGPHTINPSTPIEAFFAGLDPVTGRQVLWSNINKASSIYFHAWNSALFHGVQVPWPSSPPIAIGIKDIKTFGDLINAYVLAYTHFGWHVV